MKKASLTSKLLIVLLTIWIVIAVFRTTFNVSKVFTEERNWYGLSYEEMRTKQFGDLHPFLRFVESRTQKGSDILFFTDDLKAYYLGRYYLYPTKVIGENERIWDPQATYYDYILVYPATDEMKKKTAKESHVASYKKIATYKASDGTEGILYKK